MDVESIKQQMEDEINKDSNLIPTGHKGAFITMLDGTMLRTAIATKLNGVWQISGAIGYHIHSADHPVGEVVVKATW